FFRPWVAAITKRKGIRIYSPFSRKILSFKNISNPVVRETAAGRKKIRRRAHAPADLPLRPSCSCSFAFRSFASRPLPSSAAGLRLLRSAEKRPQHPDVLVHPAGQRRQHVARHGVAFFVGKANGRRQFPAEHAVVTDQLLHHPFGGFTAVRFPH